MSSQDASFAERTSHSVLPLSGAKVFRHVSEHAAGLQAFGTEDGPKSRVPGATDLGALKSAVADTAPGSGVSPWGDRQALAPPNRDKSGGGLVRTLRGVERVALGLVYVVVACGLPAAAYSLWTGAG